jgi:hypothetical protein
MAAMSQYLENALLNCIFNGQEFISPTIYIALLLMPATATDTGTSISDSTGIGVEVSGPGYARLSFPNWMVSQGIAENTILINFPAATGEWGIIQGIAICDSLTNGNILFFGTLSAPQHIGIAQSTQFQPNYVTITLS